MSTLRTLTLALALAGCAALVQAQGLRSEVGKPLQQANELLRQGNAKGALAKVAEAEKASGITAAERLTIDRMKAAAAQRAGNLGVAIQALEAIHPRTSGAEAGQIAEQIAAAYAQQRNNGKATEWMNRALAAGVNTPTIRQLQQYLMSASGDFAAIARDAAAAVAAAEQAGRRPDEADLLRLADAQQRLGNTNGYVATLEKLTLLYPKKDYWSAYLARLPRKPGFAERLALDVKRLRLATGTLTRTEDFMEMAQLALQAGLPAEAVRIIDEGFKVGALNATAEAGRHQRLRDLATRQAAEAPTSLAARLTEAEAAPQGDALVRVGQAFVTLGEVDKGIGLIRKGIAKGQLQRPEEAQLRLGMALLLQPNQKAVAVQTLRGIKSSDGVADLARLWAVVANS